MPATPLPPEANLGIAAKRVVAYWDYMDGVSPDDARPTEDFKAEMDARISWLRCGAERPAISGGIVRQLSELPQDLGRAPRGTP